jgi:hypothetical protein
MHAQNNNRSEANGTRDEVTSSPVFGSCFVTLRIGVNITESDQVLWWCGGRGGCRNQVIPCEVGDKHNFLGPTAGKPVKNLLSHNLKNSAID